jgi:hypothetical protein
MSLQISVTRNHNFSTGLVTRAALNAGATPTVSLTGSVDTAEIAGAAITNAKISATAAISLSKLGDLDVGRILTGGGDYPVATSLLSTSNFSDPHHSEMSNPDETFKATLLLGTNAAAVTAVMSGDAELRADGTLFIDPTFITGKSALLAQTSTPDATMIADTDTLLLVDDSETPDKYKKITFAHLKTSIDTTSNAATVDSAGVAELATYSETFGGTDSTKIVTADNIEAHRAVPIAWGRYFGGEVDANHTARRTNTGTTLNPTKGSSFNLGTCNKTDKGVYTLTISSCPSSNIMLIAQCTSWGSGADGNQSNNNYMNLVMSQTQQSGGNSSSGAAATVQFEIQTDVDNETLNNFRRADLVVYAS